MADESQALRGIDWKEAFPFTHLFRAFRVAIHPSKLLLGLLLLLLLYAGGRTLDGLWPDKHLVTGQAAYGADLIGNGMLSSDLFINPATGADRVRGIFITFFDYEVSQVNAVVGGVLGMNWVGPGSVVTSIANFLYTGPAWLFTAHPLYAALLSLWFLILWSVFGGAIARIAAVHVARDEKISIRQALRFSTSKVLSFLFAPLIPLIILLALGALLGLGGLLLYVPYVGSIALGALFVLALAVAFVMTLVLVGTIGGFNLMYPTVAVEGSDSFDAISRSFSYVFARPWRTILYTAIAVAYGALTYLFVRTFIWLMLSLAHFFVGWFHGDTHLPHAKWDGVPIVRNDAVLNAERATIWPRPDYQKLPYDVQYRNLHTGDDVGAGLLSIWVYLAISMLGAYAISYYFSANSIIYYLLRREVDATDLDDVYVEQSDEDFAEPSPDAPAAAPGAAGADSAAPGGTTPAASPSAADAPPAPPAAGDAPTSARVYDAPAGTTTDAPTDAPPSSGTPSA